MCLLFDHKPRLHDTAGCQTGYLTGCQTGLTTGLTTGCIVYTADCQTCCITRFDSRLHRVNKHPTGLSNRLFVKPV